ncbi:FAD-binding-3 domain-containing protein [Mycena indigotica]|uniref:FAD-binding-3 domain-containing protein n=1 Tax=Mycena indigotica TaxID=2126181 RepID=A0A8H6VX13_9AGAR|nr:FAD-binding-3 domain-containing protein [Mycena indigotica]KAF7297002.1 FAD-binding-3 domain-containing protein [Mycena indigotica]
MAEQLDFIIVGASVAGLASGIALKKSGHRVLVVEKAAGLGEGRPTIPYGCARIPPNGSKILSHWGLDKHISALQYQTTSPGFAVFRYEGRGEGQDLMGLQSYDEEMLSEAQGQYLTLRHVDLIHILYNEFLRPMDPPSSVASLDKSRIQVRFNAEVTSIDLEACSVTLQNGEQLTADAIIGADGPNGVVRAALKREEDEERKARATDDGDFWLDSDSESEDSQADKENVSLLVYSATVPKSAMRDHPALAGLLSYNHSAFFGANRAAFVYSVGDNLSCCIYSPEDGPTSKITDILGPVCDSGIRSLALVADSSNKSLHSSGRPLQEHEPLQSWVSESGRVVVLGEAAHPFPAGAVNSYACALEDSVFIGKIFSHTHDRSRIPELLYAFQEHREPRCNLLCDIDMKYVTSLTQDDEDTYITRDAMFRTNYQQGKNVMEIPESHEGQTMEETRMLFSYDAGDDADEWWINWGRFHDFAVRSQEDTCDENGDGELERLPQWQWSQDSDEGSTCWFTDGCDESTPRPGQSFHININAEVEEDETNWLTVYDGSTRRKREVDAKD